MRAENWGCGPTESGNSDIADEINDEHQFVIQFDRRNGTDFKCYSVGTDSFRKYIEQQTGYKEPDRIASTDIVNLCQNIARVNLSIGYYNEHESDEYLNVEEWKNTLELCRRWLSEGELPRFTRTDVDIWVCWFYQTIELHLSLLCQSPCS